VAGQEQRLEDWEEGDGDRGLERQLLKTYEDRVDVYQRAQERVATLERLMTRFRQELEARRTDVPFVDRLLARLRTLGNVVSKVWNYEVFKVEDTVVVDGQEITHSRGISVQKIVVALIILAVGWLAARYIARRTRRFVMSRFHADAGVASQVQKGVFYFLAVLVVFVALTTVEIPLTVFAYLGGALAIGVGFGAQNLINNFISGLILLMERPIKVGDIVDVDGIRGRVVNIGSRCSQVRRFDGIDMLVPNSSFLEKNVTNWTLSDLVIRFSVSVGVAYGSPIREVSHLMRKAVEEHGKVLKEPEPVIVFEEFGDNALVFTAYFWLEITTMMDQRVVASDIRFRIDKLFREAGICIAFPQRDVHLDSQRPVQIELVRPQKSAEGGSSPLPDSGEKPGDGGR